MGLMQFKSGSPLQKLLVNRSVRSAKFVDVNSQRVTYLWLERLDQTFLSVKN